MKELFGSSHIALFHHQKPMSRPDVKLPPQTKFMNNWFFLNVQSQNQPQNKLEENKQENEFRREVDFTVADHLAPATTSDWRLTG